MIPIVFKPYVNGVAVVFGGAIETNLHFKKVSSPAVRSSVTRCPPAACCCAVTCWPPCAAPRCSSAPTPWTATCR